MPNDWKINFSLEFGIYRYNFPENRFRSFFNKIEEICEIFMIFRNLLQKSSWVNLLNWTGAVQFYIHPHISVNGELSLEQEIFNLLKTFFRKKIQMFWRGIMMYQCPLSM